MSQSRLPERPVGPLATPSRKKQATSALLALTTMLTPALVSFTAAPASAASVTSASFTGEYAKSGSAVALAVVTDSTTKCVGVTGAHTAEKKGDTATTSWSFNFTAKSGSGVQTVTVTAYSNSGCNQNPSTSTASYTLDNTGPVVTGTLDPLANGQGWNKENVVVKWTATDPAGVKTTPANSSVSAETGVNGVAVTSGEAEDVLGNKATGTATVKLDKTAPTVTGSRTPVANSHGWNNTDVTASFTTSDALSGVDTQAAGKVFSTDSADHSVTGTGTDVAGNSASATVSEVKVDKTAPSLSGAPTAQPNGSNGWYTSDVTVAWTASDATSKLDGAVPANSTISGEGEGLTATQTVTDKAGNSTTASSPAVKIDETKPTTNATAPAGWNKTDTTVTLAASDGGSGVATTHYQVGTGAVQTGTSVAFTTDGEHALKYWSVDKAGNAEVAKTVTVKVDKTAPSISSSQSPAAVNGWNRSNVTVSFKCEDTGSGIASCTSDKVVSEDGRAQAVSGTATDTAGNTADATHVVNLDKTAPTITAAADRRANEFGWYSDDVTVSFTGNDSLSGIDTVTAPKILAQGEGQSANGTATDVAGNSKDAGVTGINIDKTNPVLTGAASATGWSRDDVTVTWTASDALSGLNGAVPAPSVVKGEGNDLSAGASVSDKAGNTTATTVRGIKIDRTAPNTTASVPAAVANGWHGPSVEVTLTATDNLSGVAKTFYKVGDGAAKEYTGPFSYSVKGVSTITYWSTDVAGNTEGEKTLELKLDGTAPTTAMDLPEAFATGWYADSVPVAFKATDGESGVAKTFYKVGVDGATQEWDGTFDHALAATATIFFWTVDAVGNVEAAKSQEIKVDTSNPTITGSRTPAANGFGWNNTDVTVSFVCEDEQSGVAIENCTPPVPVTNEGADQEVSGTATDNVGKTASTTVGAIKIDKTAPTLTGALPATGRTASGWYKADVKVAWTGTDALSDIDPATQPADSTITGEGANLGATATIKDKAGNTGNGSVTGVKIDRTAPVVTGATVDDLGTARSANTAGWFNSSVRVRYNATDELSKVQEVSADEVLSEDGAGQTATGSASDNADNTASTTVRDINIDSKAPTSTADIQCEGKNNFCRGAKATIALSAVDQAGLSGVKDMAYSTDAGKTWTTLAGDKGSFDITLNKSGKVSVQFKAADKAGNVETVNTIEVKYDTVAPTVSHKLDPQANAAGWNKADTTVTFTATDDSDGSGVDEATVTQPVKVTAETAGQLVNGEAYDLAGNKGTDSVTVKLDRTAPSNTPAVKSGTKGANGWYTGQVTVGFTAADELSGIATNPADVVLNSDGAAQKASGTAVDKADNEKVATLDGINIDSVKPVIEVKGLKASYTLGETTGISCTATDATSGVDANGCKVTVSGTATSVGTIGYTATATDNAGNKQETTGTYKVLYAWNGFSQPINDTAHQLDQGVSVFKGGSTIPAKFQLKNAAGQVVQAGSAPKWTTPSAGAATSAAISEDAYALSATTDGLYKYDATSQQYHYNWSTKGLAVGKFYRIGVTLDDGQTYSVSIGLR